MNETVKRTGRTTPAKVKGLLRTLAAAIDPRAAITGGMETAPNEAACHFVIDGCAEKPYIDGVGCDYYTVEEYCDKLREMVDGHFDKLDENKL